MMRRTPLKRSPFRRSDRLSRYRQRERAIPYMLFVKRLPCAAAAVDAAYPCYGPVEADHAGPRGLSHKAHDSTVIPLCREHHRQRSSFAGAFRSWNQERMREWLAGRINLTQRMAAGLGIAIPEAA